MKELHHPQCLSGFAALVSPTNTPGEGRKSQGQPYWPRQGLSASTSLPGPAGTGQHSHSPCKGSASPAHHRHLRNDQQHPGEVLAALQLSCLSPFTPFNHSHSWPKGTFAIKPAHTQHPEQLRGAGAQQGKARALGTAWWPPGPAGDRGTPGMEDTPCQGTEWDKPPSPADTAMGTILCTVLGTAEL